MQESTEGGGRSEYFNLILKDYIPDLFDKYSLSNGFTNWKDKTFNSDSI
ncbi:MAG: hypothetical protein ACQEWI_00280 [Bacillota bacterium]